MSDHIEPRRHDAEGSAYRWAFRTSAIAICVLAVAGALVAGMLRGSSGVWGALAGAALAGVAALGTQAAMVFAYEKAPHVFASIVGGSWLAKMTVILVGMLVLSKVAGIDRASFGVVALIGVVVTLSIDLLAVRRARIPHVVPGSESEVS